MAMREPEVRPTVSRSRPRVTFGALSTAASEAIAHEPISAGLAYACKER
jgi:hypothetical protein